MRPNDEIIDILTRLKDERSMSLSELARKVGMAKSALSRYFNKTREFPLNRVEDFAKALGVSSEYILGFSEEVKNDITTIYNKLNETRQTNVYTFAEEQLEEQTDDELYSNIVEFPNGRSTAAGSPLDGTSEDGQLQSMLVMDRELIPDNADELITVAGNSMEPTLMEGQQVFIRYQPYVEKGEIAIVAIEDEGVTCKRVYFNDSKEEIILESDNDDYEDMIFSTDEIRIIGKVLL